MEAWGAKAKKPHIFRKRIGIAAFGGKAKKPLLFLKMCGLLALVPQASKKHFAKKHFGIPVSKAKHSLSCGACVRSDLARIKQGRPHLRLWARHGQKSRLSYLAV